MIMKSLFEEIKAFHALRSAMVAVQHIEGAEDWLDKHAPDPGGQGDDAQSGPAVAAITGGYRHRNAIPRR